MAPTPDPTLEMLLRLNDWIKWDTVQDVDNLDYNSWSTCSKIIHYWMFIDPTRGSSDSASNTKTSLKLCLPPCEFVFSASSWSHDMVTQFYGSRSWNSRYPSSVICSAPTWHNNCAVVLQSRTAVSRTPAWTAAAAPPRLHPTPASACLSSPDSTVSSVRKHTHVLKPDGSGGSGP